MKKELEDYVAREINGKGTRRICSEGD